MIDQVKIPNLEEADERDLAAIEGAAGWLATYALNKKTAIRFRLTGRVNDALAMEEAAENAYQHLPASWRW